MLCSATLAEAADMPHRPREAFSPGPQGSSHFRSLEAQGSSSANHVGIPPKGSGKTRHRVQPRCDNQTQWVPKKRARGKTDYQKGFVKPSNSESEDQSSTSESSWMACEAPHPVLGKLRSAWMACDAFLGQESPITGQAKQAYTSACQARRENEPLLRQLKASQLRASTIQTILDTMPRSRTKALDEIDRLYTKNYEVVLNELDEARAEVEALEDIMGSSMTSQGKGSLAKQPETDSAPRCTRKEGGGTGIKCSEGKHVAWWILAIKHTGLGCLPFGGWRVAWQYKQSSGRIRACQLSSTPPPGCWKHWQLVAWLSQEVAQGHS